MRLAAPKRATLTAPANARGPALARAENKLEALVC